MNQEIQHTPGPWTVNGSAIESSDRLLASVYDERESDIEPTEAIANAALIAAAPELLDALRYARRFLNSSEHDTSYVDAAIAKATGQSDQKDSR